MPQRIGCIRLMTLAAPAAEAKARIDAFLAADPHAEFSRMHIVRGPRGFRPTARARVCRRVPPRCVRARGIRIVTRCRAAILCPSATALSRLASTGRVREIDRPLAILRGALRGLAPQGQTSGLCRSSRARTVRFGRPRSSVSSRDQRTCGGDRAIHASRFTANTADVRILLSPERAEDLARQLLFEAKKARERQ